MVCAVNFPLKKIALLNRTRLKISERASIACSCLPAGRGLASKTRSGHALLARGRGAEPGSEGNFRAFVR